MDNPKFYRTHPRYYPNLTYYRRPKIIEQSPQNL